MYGKAKIIFKKEKKFFYLLIVIFLLTASQTSFAKRIKNKGDLIAIVNGKGITKVDYERQLLIAEQQLTNQGQVFDETKMEDFKASILENLIDGELLFQESQKRGLNISEERIGEQFDAVKNQFNSTEEFDRAMGEMNYTENSLKEDIGRRIAVEEFIEKEISKNISVSDEESLEYYDNHPEFFTEPEKIKASHILIRIEETSNTAQKEEALEKIKEIKKKFEAGEDFAALATTYSEGPNNIQGGDLGYFQRGQMVKPFEDAAFSLKTGEISDIVETQYGYHLIKVTNRQPEVKVPFDYMKERINEYLKQNKIMSEVAVLLEKMRTEATIERLTKTTDENATAK